MRVYVIGAISTNTLAVVRASSQAQARRLLAAPQRRAAAAKAISPSVWPAAVTLRISMVCINTYTHAYMNTFTHIHECIHTSTSTSGVGGEGYKPVGLAGGGNAADQHDGCA